MCTVSISIFKNYSILKDEGRSDFEDAEICYWTHRFLATLTLFAGWKESPSVAWHVANISTYHNIMTSVHWLVLPSMPLPGLIRHRILSRSRTSRMGQQGFSASCYDGKRKGEKHKQEETGWEKLQVHPCNNSSKPIHPFRYFRSIAMFIGRIKVSFDKSFLFVRSELLS